MDFVGWAKLVVSKILVGRTPFFGDENFRFSKF